MISKATRESCGGGRGGGRGGGGSGACGGGGGGGGGVGRPHPPRPADLISKIVVVDVVVVVGGWGAKKSEMIPVIRRAMVELIATMDTLVAGELNDGELCAEAGYSE